MKTEENGVKNANSTIDDCWMTKGRRWRQVSECNDVNGMVKSPKVNGQEQLSENKIQVEARMPISAVQNVNLKQNYK